MPPDLTRYADLIVNFGANVQEGQIVDLASALGKEELTRAITASAYKRGAKFVDVYYWDPHLKRERVQHVADEELDFVPSWYGERALQLGDERGAAISLSGPNVPRLWDDVLYVCRLDQDDPVKAWRERDRALAEVAQRLTQRAFDAIHLDGPGTDLTVGLLPTSVWNGGGDETADGISHMANLPTEEVFTTPDPERVQGMVRATMPLYTQGVIVERLTVRFENGHAVQIEGDSGVDALRALVEQNEGG